MRPSIRNKLLLSLILTCVSGCTPNNIDSNNFPPEIKRALLNDVASCPQFQFNGVITLGTPVPEIIFRADQSELDLRKIARYCFPIVQKSNIIGVVYVEKNNDRWVSTEIQGEGSVVDLLNRCSDESTFILAIPAIATVLLGHSNNGIISLMSSIDDQELEMPKNLWIESETIVAKAVLLLKKVERY